MGDIDQTQGDVQGGDQQDPTWLEQVSKDLRFDYLKEFPHQNDLIRSYDETRKELEQLKGDDVVRIPGEGAGKREINNFRKALGIPTSADGYEFALDDLPEGIQFNEEELNGFREFALNNNLSGKQANELLKYEVQRKSEEMQARTEFEKQEMAKTEEILKGIYGNKYEEQLEKASRMIDKIGGEKLRDEFNRTGLGNSPELAKLLFKISDNFNEGNFTFGSAGMGAGVDEGPDYDKLYPSMKGMPDRR